MNTTVLSIYGGIMAFLVYTCMYVFRKIYTVSTFDGMQYAGLDFKTIIVIAQLLGYTASKFIGISVISSSAKQHTAIKIIALMSAAGLCLVGFACLPAPLNIACMFFNGLSLGLIWGLVFSYIEGRQHTELMGAFLATSFIFSSGLVKSIGKFILNHTDLNAFTMPAVAACIFIVPMCLFVFLLNRLPAPSAKDKLLRQERKNMSRDDRRKFFIRFFPGIILMVGTYVLITVLRDVRDNFIADIWKSLGYGNSPAIFTTTEFHISWIVLLVIASMIFYKRNAGAFLLNLILVGFGILLSLTSTLLWMSHKLDPVLWMVLSGLGLYLAYVPFNCILYERLIAAFRVNGNVGYLMYLSDSFGYVGSLFVLLFKTFFAGNINWLAFYSQTVIISCIIGLVLTGLSFLYFYKKLQFSVR